MNRKKLLALLLALSMVLSLLPTAAFAAEGDEIETGTQAECTCEIEDGTHTEGCPLYVEPEGNEAVVDDTQDDEGNEDDEPAEDYGVSLLADEPTEAEKLQAAITEAENGDTVTMTADIVGMTTLEIITIPEDKEITLDMAGHSITVAEGFSGRPIANKGTLTVTGNGTIDASASTGGYGAINNLGTLTIENGTFRGNSEANASNIRNYGADAVLVINGGTFDTSSTAVLNYDGTATLNGGTYTTHDHNCSRCGSNWAYVIRTYTDGEAGVSPKLYINGGSYTGTQGALSSSTGYLEVNGGTFKTVACANNHNAIFYPVYAAGEYGEILCVINDGTFENTGTRVAVLLGNDNTNGDGGINADAISRINGGTFISKGPSAVGVSENTAKNSIITGGTFSSDVSAYLAEGLSVIPVNGVMQVVDEADVDSYVVAKIGENKYYSLEDAIAAANSGDTVTIIKEGEYAAFAVPAGITIKGAAGAEVTFTGSFTNVGANVTFEGVSFVDAKPLDYGIGDNLTVQNCRFVGNGSGTAMYIHTPNITVTGCTFENYRRGYYTCGDNHAAGKLTFTDNTFFNVTIPFDGYWGKAATDSTEFTITGNKFSDGSYVQLWDYTQYLNSSAADRQGSALKNVTVTGNTGDYQLVLVHTDWRWATGSITTDAANVVKSHHVDIDKGDQAGDIAGITAAWAGEGEMPGFERQTTPRADGFYHLPEGDYTVTVTYKNGAVKTQDLTVTTPVVGSAQTMTVTTDKSVAQIGETKYETLAAAINAAQSGDTVKLLADVELTATLNMPQGMTLTIDGDGHKLTPAESFQANGHSAAIAADTSAPYSSSSSYTLKNLTFEGFTGLVRVVRVNFCDALIENCVFNGNTVGSVVTSAYGKVTVKDSSFTGNTVAGYAVIDIGSDVPDTDEHTESATITGNRFTGNEAKTAVIFALTPTDITDNDFTENTVGTAGVYAAANANITGNCFSENIHSGTNPNASAVLAGPSIAREYTINITGNAFDHAISKDGTQLFAVFVEDWSKKYGTDVSYDLSNNYWGGASPVRGTDYGVGGDADVEAKVTVSSFASSFTKTASGVTVTTHTEHTFGAWVTDTAAQVGVAGSRHRDCTVCGHRETGTISALPAPAPVEPTTPDPDPAEEEEEDLNEQETPLEARPWLFTDVTEGVNWFYASVKAMYDRNLISGLNETVFGPKDSITRGQLVAILYRMEKEPEVTGESLFADVADDMYYAKAIRWAHENGVVKGQSDNIFGADDAIRRQDVAVILYRYAQYKGYARQETGDLSVFTDVDQLQRYAVEAMTWAVGAGLISGVGNNKLNPRGGATRAEACALLDRFLNWADAHEQGNEPEGQQ